MSAKNLSPRSFCILGLVCVAVIAGILYVTVSWEKTLLGTSLCHGQLGKNAFRYFSSSCRFSLLHHLQDE